jgi:prolyl-tRNA synthetase
VVETHYDEKGIAWPVTVAPYEAVVTVLKLDDTTVAAAERIYEDLGAAGIDVLIDDRDERPGVKFNDAELIGIPYRVTVGPRGLAEGIVEINHRASGTTDEVSVTEAVLHLVARIERERL